IADFSRFVKENGHSDVILSARNLSFAYGQTPILQDLMLDVKANEVVAIVGANGCGKSTLLRHLNGLLRPKQGRVELFGKDISNSTTASMACEVGYLGQNPNNYLFEETLQKELEFTLKNLRIPAGQWEERMGWALRVLDLERYRQSFPRDLSCGQRERAALASVIVGKPRILILDEPTRGMDFSNKTKLAGILESLKGEGMTTILVTHDYRFVAEHANRVLLLSGGQLSDLPIERVVHMAKDAACTEA
ncbi:MAG: energy-coupling factor ABC transporter ATP-binding protein, partial [Methanomassiliicoccales archaeon]|nr:energy-coupling factor ABC transporter ATP-binding protein [Methanomassiliicoccales archaeon]